MSPTEQAAAPSSKARQEGWNALAWSLVPFFAGAVATAAGLGPALGKLFGRTAVDGTPGRASARGIDTGFQTLSASPATAAAFGLWLLLAILGLGLVARCLRRGSAAVRTVGAGLGLFYLGLVGLLVTGLIG